MRRRDADHDDAFLRSLGIEAVAEREYVALRTPEDIARDQHALRQERTAADMVVAFDRITREHESFGSRYTNAAFYEILHQIYFRAMCESKADLARSIELTARSFVSRISMEPHGLVDPLYAKQLVDGLRRETRGDEGFYTTISP